MKKATVLAASFALLFLGSIATAQAGSHISIGFSFGAVPVIPYGYYYPPYPPYYYQGYYSAPIIYPAYGPYGVSGYYGYSTRRLYAPRYYNGVRRDRYQRRSNVNRRSGSGRWRY
jgi:hypothetical protein